MKDTLQDLYRMSKNYVKELLVKILKNSENRKSFKTELSREDIFSLEYLENTEVKFKKHLIQFKELILIM